MPLRLGMPGDDKLESLISTSSIAVPSAASSSSSESASQGVIERPRRSPATSASTSSGSGDSTPSTVRAQHFEQDHVELSSLEHATSTGTSINLLQQRLQALSSSPLPPHPSYPHRRPAHLASSASSGTRTPASPPATTSQAASLRLQELARSLQAQAQAERERVREQELAEQEQERRRPRRIEVRIFDRFPVGTDSDDEEEEDAESMDEEEGEEEGGHDEEDLEGDRISFGDGSVPSEEVLRKWYDARMLEMREVDANGVKIRRTSRRRRDLLVGR